MRDNLPVETRGTGTANRERYWILNEVTGWSLFLLILVASCYILWHSAFLLRRARCVCLTKTRSRQKITGFLDILMEDLLGRTVRGSNHTNPKCRKVWITFEDLQRRRYRGGLLLSSLILMEGTRSVRPLLVERLLKDLFLWGTWPTSSSEEASLSS